MRNVRLFDTTDSAVDILNEIQTSGIAGIHGGRIAVRELLAAVHSLAEKEGIAVGQDNGFVHAQCTDNHSQTELAYLFDSRAFEPDQALDAVKAAYERFNPPANWG